MKWKVRLIRFSKKMKENKISYKKYKTIQIIQIIKYNLNYTNFGLEIIGIYLMQ